MRLEVWAPDGIGEITAGTDLGELISSVIGAELQDGDIVAVTSKIVSKAEGRWLPETQYEAAMAAETADVVARRQMVRIVRSRLGITQAAAGLDRSNVPGGGVLLLPVDPDASARKIRDGLVAHTGRRVGVLITDTAGRAWREGQTDHTIGAAHVLCVDDHAGRVDAHGHPLAVTAMAMADQLAAAADLVKGKLSGRPVAVVRGRADLVTEEAGSSAPLLRDPERDLFAHGTREAVLRAALAAVGEVSAYAELVELDHAEATQRILEFVPAEERDVLARILNAAAYPDQA